MTSRFVFGAIFAGAVLAGWTADRPVVRPPVVLGGYQVLSADLHVHSSLLGNGTFTPWGLVLEATRQGLDAIAITGHNTVLEGHVGRRFAQAFGGPIVLVGDEIQTLRSHLVAVGVEHAVSARLPVAQQIDDVHRQGGVAIAAHPLRRFWPGFDPAAVARLDGSEVCHPDIFVKRPAEADFEAFYGRVGKAAIGSSDFHGTGRMGGCRTYVFARDRTAEGVLDAIREGRTVVYGKGGKAYGDPALVPLAATRPDLREAAAPVTRATAADWLGFVAGLAGLAGLIFLSGSPTARHPDRAAGF